MKSLVSQFASNEAAATSIEYALIAGSLSIVILVAVQTVGTNLTTTFTTLQTALK